MRMAVASSNMRTFWMVTLGVSVVALLFLTKSSLLTRRTSYLIDNEEESLLEPVDIKVRKLYGTFAMGCNPEIVME